MARFSLARACALAAGKSSARLQIAANSRKWRRRFRPARAVLPRLVSTGMQLSFRASGEGLALKGTVTRSATITMAVLSCRSKPRWAAPERPCSIDDNKKPASPGAPLRQQAPLHQIAFISQPFRHALAHNFANVMIFAIVMNGFVRVRLLAISFAQALACRKYDAQ